MAPKGHRTGSSGRLGARTNSATKMAANLQFTQKDGGPSKHSDKQKKAGYGNEKAPLGRVNSSQRVQSKEHLQPIKRGTSSQRLASAKPKAGFTLASPKDEEDEEEDWVSSESGAATPNNDGSDSEETASEVDGVKDVLHSQHSEHGRIPAQLPRIETARQTDFASPTGKDIEPLSAPTPTLPQAQQFMSTPDTQHDDANHLQAQLRRMEFDTTKETRTDPPLPSPRNSKRPSRPASTYSQSGKQESRPHPLIRGISTGHVNLGKPIPLAPLTVVTGGAAPPQLSTSPASSVYEDNRTYVASSPTSTATSSSFPDDPAKFLQDRRASISSARSIATVPAQSFFRPDSAIPKADRSRTLSMMSSSPSSAALSALAHLPAITRPPSPQSVIFFPPVNPHANIDAIHPLLPGPYLSNHLTVLARRNPLRESYDRVVRAKAEAARQTH